MDVSAVNKEASTYAVSGTAEAEKNTASKKTTEESTAAATDAAAVYEKDTATVKDSANKIYDRDSVVARLKADQQSRIDSMNSLVQKLLGKQANKFNLANGKNLSSTFSELAGKVDQDTIDAAKKSISEDGYWGVNKTSDRLVSMAIALSGGDTEKADEMMAAIEKGYNQATKAWGKELPQICQDTMAATRQKMEDWKNGKTTAEDYADYLS